MSKDNGGNAFPAVSLYYDEWVEANGKTETTKYSEEGMTLRDYFAGQALAGRTRCSNYPSWAEVAKDVYIAADAMLNERGKE